MTAVLQARGLARRYGAVQAVDGVDLAVRAGEVVGLLGPNGAGKSTTFRLLAGVERPDRGRVLLEGRDITTEALHRRARAGLAYLPQHPSLLPPATVLEQVGWALSATGGDPGRARDLLAAADLEHLADRRAGTLSGGERRRVEIARCLALDPRVVLLDEPYSGVDPVHVEVLQEQIRAIAGQGRGVLLTDHAVRETLRACDRVVLLDGGTIVARGSPAAIMADATVQDRYLGAGFALTGGSQPLHERA